MGHQLIKQPNGLYAVWSSVVDHFVLYDATIEDIIEDEVQSYRERTTARIRAIAARLDNPHVSPDQITFEQACELVREIHENNNEALEELGKIEAAARTPQPNNE